MSKILCCGYGNPVSEEDNLHLLSFSDFLKQEKEMNISEELIVSYYDRFRCGNNLDNKIFTIATNKEHTKAKIVFFDNKPDGKVHHVLIDEDGNPYIEIE